MTMGTDDQIYEDDGDGGQPQFSIAKSPAEAPANADDHRGDAGPYAREATQEIPEEGGEQPAGPTQIGDYSLPQSVAFLGEAALADFAQTAADVAIPQAQVDRLAQWASDIDSAALPPATGNTSGYLVPQLDGFRFNRETDGPPLESFLATARQMGLRQSAVDKMLAWYVASIHDPMRTKALKGEMRRDFQKYRSEGLNQEFEQIAERQASRSERRSSGPSKEELALTKLMRSDFDQYLRSGGRERLMALREARGAGAGAYDDSEG
jgi:hypothetical protein